MAHDEPSARTDRQYQRVVSNLFARFERETDRGWEESPGEFCDWLASLRPGLAANTWRGYRAAIIRWMKEHGSIEIVEKIRALDSNPCKSRKQTREDGKAASMKMRGMPLAMFKDLLKALRASRSQFDANIAELMRATVLTGLRPSEWASARIEGNRLIVKNGKFSPEQARACGRYRVLHLDDFPATAMAPIRRAAEIAATVPDWDRYYERLRKRLLRIQKELWPRRNRRITFYSCRHQFCANHKAAGLSRIEVAALMGHASDATATEHYQRARNGWANTPVATPDPKNIALVRAVFNNRHTATTSHIEKKGK